MYQCTNMNSLGTVVTTDRSLSPPMLHRESKRHVTWHCSDFTMSCHITDYTVGNYK